MAGGRRDRLGGLGSTVCDAAAVLAVLAQAALEPKHQNISLRLTKRDSLDQFRVATRTCSGVNTATEDEQE